MNKNQAITLVNINEGKTTLTNKNTHWANLSLYRGNEAGWWLNVPFDKFSEKIHFILDNEKSDQFFVVRIPCGAIKDPRFVFRNKEDTADIFISAINTSILDKSDALVDTQSNSTGHDFSFYDVELISYSTKNVEQLYPEEVPSSLKEGSKKSVLVNSYERNSQARDICIKVYGLNCSVCGINFKNVYGERGEGFIHVHHLVAISDIGDEYEIDPIQDLRPVCPNCHAMLHIKDNISIEKLKKEIKI